MTRALVLLLSLASSACITTPASETGSTATARKLALPACGDGLLENAEDGDSRSAPIAGRGGYWFTFVDAEGSTIAPQGTFTMDAGGPDGSKRAAHIKGKIAESGSSLYAGMGFSISEPRGPYDASRYGGVSFMAKGPGRVRFKLPDGNTAPEGGVCKDCYNDFGVDLALTSEWERYTLAFEDLAQQPNWGDREPEVDASRLIALQWQVGSPGRDFDVWVDDVEFVGCE